MKWTYCNCYATETYPNLFCFSFSNSSSSATTSALPAGGALPYYHPPSTPTAYTQPVVGLSMGPPYMQPGQPGAALGTYRAPTPPQTPTQNQVVQIFSALYWKNNILPHLQRRIPLKMIATYQITWCHNLESHSMNFK
jgi:hypothetical protein